MKASNQKNTFTVLFLVGIALYMTACGSPANTETYDFSSREPITTDPSVEAPTTGSGTYVATCNYRTNSSIGAKLKMFVDKNTNSYRMDLVQVRLTTIPADFENNTTYFGMWKWLGLTGATTQTLGGEALRFAIFDSYTGKYLTDFKTTLIWKDVSAVAKSLGIPSATVFFQRVTIIVNLAAPSDTYSINEWDALKVVSYSTATQKVSSTLDVLLPPFAANPTEYAKETTGGVRAPVLQNLHPLASLKGSNNTSAQLLEMTKSYCF
ncbi:hypothetical protein D3C87_1183940 [compost metagenome]